ncbi:MAG: hypothetical protein IKO23_09710 [Bacteroidales bacterium]|nr:hypothetical protein [Bacteroidales bacterium]
MADQKENNEENKMGTGDFGPVFTQFEGKPKEAIRHLKNVKQGECLKALYREETGYVDIVWGVGGKDGYGLCHIIEQHEAELKQLGFEVEDFIPVVFALGKYSESPRENKIRLAGEKFMLVVKTKWNERDKRFVMTAFDLRPVSRKNPKRAKEAQKRGNRIPLVSNPIPS